MIEDPGTIRPRPWAFGLLVAYALATRVLPYVLHVGFGMEIERASRAYPWNYSPIYALALVGGVVLAPRLALLLPLAVYLAGDLIIAGLMGPKWAFYPDQPVTYAALAVLALCGMPLRRRWSAAPIAVGGIGGVLAFFLITNFGVWLSGGGLVRPHTLAGLLQCLADGLPFLRPTLLSMVFFLPILCSPLVVRRVPQLSMQPA